MRWPASPRGRCPRTIRIWGNLRGEYSVDLNACETAHDLAWALRLLGDRLHPRRASASMMRSRRGSLRR